MCAGKACHAAEPGCFRICYAATPIEGLMEGIRRVTSIVSMKHHSQPTLNGHHA